jgi:tetratricopeptide (TPR) repeat protein
MHRFLFIRLFAATAIVFGLLGAARSQSQTGDVVLVLPFENTSNQPLFNWVGESFSDSLAELFNQPGVAAISSDERELAYTKLRLPLTTIPSRATAVKLARETKATLVVIGTYSITPGQNGAADSIQGSARVVNVSEGRLMGKSTADGRWVTREYDFGGALTTLQQIQGRLAYNILSQRIEAFPFSQNQMVQQASKVPPFAFEAFIKGAQTRDADASKPNFFKNALKIYADANSGAVYPQAAYELGQYYFKQQNWKDSAEYFSKVQKKEPRYVQSAFYAAFAYYKQGDNTNALARMAPLAAEVPLTGIYNNAGALSLASVRAESDADARNRLILQAVQWLGSADRTSPDDPLVTFNYGYALFMNGRFAEAAEQFKAIVAADPRDGQAQFLLAKSLERAGRSAEATPADDQARRFLPAYAKWQTEWQKSQTASDVQVRLRQTLSPDDLLTRETTVTLDDTGKVQEVMAKARELYSAGLDEEALAELRRVITLDPTNGEAYLLIGRINLRRADQEPAISALKTALFWDAKLIDAHILLGRIYIDRGDRAQAMSHARSAMQIDPNNQEAIALQRLVETGGK